MKQKSVTGPVLILFIIYLFYPNRFRIFFTCICITCWLFFPKIISLCKNFIVWLWLHCCVEIELAYWKTRTLDSIIFSMIFFHLLGKYRFCKTDNSVYTNSANAARAHPEINYHHILNNSGLYIVLKIIFPYKFRPFKNCSVNALPVQTCFYFLFTN